MSERPDAHGETDDAVVRDLVRGSIGHPSDRFRDDLRETVAGALRGDVAVQGRPGSDASSRRRPRLIGAGLGAAAAAVIVVAAVVVSDGPTATVVPATEAPTSSSSASTVPTVATSAAPDSVATTVAPTTTVGSDPELMAALTGHRWVLESASDGSYSPRLGLVPWVEFGTDGTVRGSDGCNVFGARSTIFPSGRLLLEDLGSTTAACDETVPQVAFTGAGRVQVLDDGERLQLTGDPANASSWQFRRLDALDVAQESDLVGRWSVSLVAPGYLELAAPDPVGTATVGPCSTSWTIDGGRLATGFAADASACVDRSDATYAALFESLAGGADVRVERNGGQAPTDPAAFVLSSGDVVFRAGFAGRVTGPVVEVSPRAQLPSLRIADEVRLALEEREATPARSWSPRVELADDGSLVVLDLVASTVTAYEVDGTVRWSTPVPDEIDGRAPWDVEVGPDRVLYLSYAAEYSASFVLVAVPIDGPTAGQAVGVWPTDWQCVENFCGTVTLAASGVVLDAYGVGDASVQPYVGPDGRPSGATYTAPVLAAATYGSGPRLPTGVGVDDAGLTPLGSFRTTVSLGTNSWTFDAFLVAIAEGTYTFFDAQPDGSVLTSFQVVDERGAVAGVAWVDLLPDDTVQAWWLPDDIGVVVSVARIGGERYAAVVTPDGAAYRLVHLVPA